VIQFFVFQFWPFPQIDLTFLKEGKDSQENLEFSGNHQISESTRSPQEGPYLSRSQRRKQRKQLVFEPFGQEHFVPPVPSEVLRVTVSSQEPAHSSKVEFPENPEDLEVDSLSSGKERINWEKVLKTEGQELNTLLSLLDEKRRLGSEPGELRVTEEAALSRNPRGSLKSKGENPLDKSKVLRVFGFKPASSATGKLPRPKPFSGASSLRRKEK